MHVVYISDGKAGHRSQALGLYQAMQRQHADCSFQEISIADLPILSLIGSIFSRKCAQLEQTPTFIFGVGSHTHLRVWLMGKVYPHAKTVILMKPSLPLSFFDYAVIPEHDAVPASNKVIVTQGALNPIVNQQRHQTNRILIALGGSSKRHGWNAEKVLTAIQGITEQQPQATIILTTSRRTPSDFLTQLQQQSYAAQLQIFPVEQTPQGWIFEEMQKAEAVWVTEDSVSMLFEALTAGCRVGLIEIDRLKQDRITNSIDLLLKEEKIGLEIQITQLPVAGIFSEADSVVEELLKR
ncbi:mitochondrial fission ELM1 family protein [Acinetobacter brisouii]|uniref:mitochondrial fission ELM1 family protein n=1 Tax=Acinetobacter brisouii TaxID=396323 RepID=UPI0005F85016|nr:ELM1/GtrOC1 family putative glycosyltransferase [Acinetobacter brisouii]KJV37757.1 nucleoside-diphosphate sugar epimerase [Acinetobacter brisouii]